MAGQTPVTIQNIDGLIEHLKSGKPYDATGALKLWEAFQTLYDNIKTIGNNLSSATSFQLFLDAGIGNINGSNKIFGLSYAPLDIVIVFQNGLQITNFSIDGQTITMINPPQIGDTLKFLYRKTI